MDESRRDFLKMAGYTALCLGGGFPLLRGLASAQEHTDAAGATGLKQWAMVVDTRKCLEEKVRRACIEACNREHNIPVIPDPKEEVKWIWTEKYENAFPDAVHRHTVPSLRHRPVLVLCNHCTNPPCVKVCPTQATWKREEDGIVMMDMHRCIGCRYCMAACPYGSRSFNWRDPRPYIEDKSASTYPTRTMGVVEKCDFCVERLRAGLEPACVVAANSIPGKEGALTFGNLSDPESDVSILLERNHTLVREESLGTGPNVYYII
jgi:Fe-S-cluster-containing dehydrogenase component